MRAEFISVTDYGLEQSAAVLTRGFSDYFGPIPFTRAALLQAGRVDSVDLGVSRVMLREGSAVGVALIARRGWTSRLAGMALVPEARRQGAGAILVEQLLREARARADRAMVLEVIAQNAPAVKLYDRTGFRRRRRLLGFSGQPRPAAAHAPHPAEVDLRALAAAGTANPLPDLPWQISPETIAQLTPPVRAYQLGGCGLAISDPAGPVLSVRGVALTRDTTRGELAGLLGTLAAQHPGKAWRLSAIWPEEWAEFFLAAGLHPTELSQWQMVQELR
jgi:ribosomal protein S18 acetylase RimI-like enzyme